MHDFRDSLVHGQHGEMFFRHWMAKRYPGLCWDDVDLRTDKQGVDGIVRCRESVQVKWDKAAHRTGNVFVEMVSDVKRGTPGWAVKCAADVLYYLCPGLGYVFRVELAGLPELAAEWERTYPSRDVQNDGWVTRGILVPLAEFDRAFPAEMDEQLRDHGLRKEVA